MIKVVKMMLMIVSCLVAAALMISWVLKKMKKTRSNVDSASHNEDWTSSTGSFNCDFSIIVAATNNFSEAKIIGRGGYGNVYKGVLANGQYIAIKRLPADSNQGGIQFKNELLLVAKLRHRNLVRIIGCCLERKERILLYEFMPNGSLDHFLFDAERRKVLDWPTRYNIIEGVVRGMVYFHEDSRLRIIHRNLKASNILLDQDMNPRISDFGMARLFQVDQTHEEIGKITGTTLAYFAPEYAQHGIISIKSDVYSFGVLLLEIISGQMRWVARGEDVEDLLTSVWKHWSSGESIGVIDSMLCADSRPQILRCIHIGLLCIQEATKRPTMSSVLLMLKNQSLSLPAPSSPSLVTNVR